MLLKANLKPLGIPVTVSELAYGYQERGGGQDVLDVIDSINIHILPYFAPDAVGGEKMSLDSLSFPISNFGSWHIGWQSWHDVKADLTWFIDRGKGKKMYLDEVCITACAESFLNSHRMAGPPFLIKVLSQTAA